MYLLWSSYLHSKKARHATVGKSGFAQAPDGTHTCPKLSLTNLFEKSPTAITEGLYSSNDTWGEGRRYLFIDFSLMVSMYHRLFTPSRIDVLGGVFQFSG